MILKPKDMSDLERVLALLLDFARIVRYSGVSWMECEQAYKNLLDIVAMLALITGADPEQIKKHLTEMVEREEGERDART